MKPSLLTTQSSVQSFLPNPYLHSSLHLHRPSSNFLRFISSNPQILPSIRCFSHSSKPFSSLHHQEPLNPNFVHEEPPPDQWKVEVQSPLVPASAVPPAKLSLNDRAFFLLAFIACTTSVAFTSLVIAAVPTLFAMGRAATSLAKLADTAREELPSTMAAIRLSGMEISDLTLELSDLSQEIADGVSKSTQAVQAAEAGIRQIGTLARQQTASMIQERASLPIISLQPVVTGAAKKTSRAVGQATKTIINMISGKDFSSDDEDDDEVNRLES
ncbi:hypothetical protein VitviT2T_005291 [Vitis vinifera]|uniref:Transmembrane protein n=1 Tax=Vitis vinifera TaxID=29760 RepID=A0ABY9BT57_VITVI|nr:uncharacterized protein LOC100240963 isoform X2 [Vitis vinifera]WJZ85772.1 hypothetical protein VitviT2T_005291 [Vitis vinifera]|eukprot:XP_002265708.1 PREDICTED: uncharacterized protein LOC100240963 isoform X1 [Vitis vinifera]